MSQALTSRVAHTVTQAVYVRRAQGAGLMVNGEQHGFVFEPRLRCNTITEQRGVNPGHAKFDVVPDLGAIEPIEHVLPDFGADDHVRVVVWPADADILASHPPANAHTAGGWVLFEGVLMRGRFLVRRDGEAEDEGLRLVGVPMPLVDDWSTDHLCTGRWLPTSEDADEAEPYIAESIDLPAIFNAGGRGNRHRSITWAGAADAADIEAHAFTHDEDPRGRHWTVREALGATIVMLLYGDSDSGGLPRHVMLEPQTLEALAGNASGERWDGLESRCPEVSVQGLGALSAIEAVCQASGFEMALEPLIGHIPSGPSGGGRRYQLRIWRRHSGPLSEFRILPRESPQFNTPEQATLRNNVHAVRGMRDTSQTRNEIVARGRVVIEGVFPLKPFWRPDDVDDGELSADMQLAAHEAGDSAYHARHVVGGEQFDAFGHVGRVWGVDCVGGFEGYGDDVELYHHDEHGFDFVSHLELNSANALRDERQALGVGDPIRWTRRVRHALPLVNPEAQARGIDLVIECSEEGGEPGTWHRVDMQIQTQRETLGVRLHDARLQNLANVNLETLHSGETPPVEESWWALIKDHKLAFRLHCAIEADHAGRFEAERRATSPTRYRFAELLELDDVEEIWQAPDSWFGAEGEWRKIIGGGYIAPPGSGAVAAAPVADLARRRRDAMEAGRVTCAAQTWLMRFDRWRIGDRIWGIRGRDLRFDVTAGGGRNPAIVSVEYTLAPESEQQITINLDDEAMTRGGTG